MIRFIKSNKFISLLLIIMCIIMLFNPLIYAKSCLDAISIWTFKVLPLLFPFFIITRLVVNLSQPKQNFMDKFFNKLYHTPKGSFLTFFLSTLSGYPMGAKLISSMYENNQINNLEAKKMLSFCSVSGPMFMVGTVGLSMLYSFKAGIIILISNIIASLLNGVIYRGKNEKHFKETQPSFKTNENILTNSVYDSLISILMVASYIMLSFLIIDMLNNLKIISLVSKFICCVFNINKHQNVVKSILCGLIEITRGILDLSQINISLSLKTIISSGLIGFGGISVIMQSVGFLSKLNISLKTMIIQKITQSLICVLVATALSLLFI